MNKKSDGVSTAVAVICTLGILLLIGWIGTLSTPKCSMDGCNNDAKSDSNYCYIHSYRYSNKNYSSGYKSCSSSSSSSSSSRYSGSSSAVSSAGSSTGKSNSSSSGKSSSKNTYKYDSYDDGYEDVYLDDDYDWDRYLEDDDYASGVDDALEDEEEYGEDW